MSNLLVKLTTLLLNTQELLFTVFLIKYTMKI